MKKKKQFVSIVVPELEPLIHEADKDYYRICSKCSNFYMCYPGDDEYRGTEYDKILACKKNIFGRKKISLLYWTLIKMKKEGRLMAEYPVILRGEKWP